jgi:hypothetical protein
MVNQKKNCHTERGSNKSGQLEILLRRCRSTPQRQGGFAMQKLYCDICAENIADFFSDLKQLHFCRQCWDNYLDKVAAEYLIPAEEKTEVISNDEY